MMDDGFQPEQAYGAEWPVKLICLKKKKGCIYHLHLI